MHLCWWKCIDIAERWPTPARQVACKEIGGSGPEVRIKPGPTSVAGEISGNRKIQISTRLGLGIMEARINLKYIIISQYTTSLNHSMRWDDHFPFVGLCWLLGGGGEPRHLCVKIGLCWEKYTFLTSRMGLPG